MRVIQRALIFCLMLATVGPAASAQTPTPPPTPPPAPAKPTVAKKPQSRLRAVAGKLADSAATAAAGMATDSLLGAKGKSVANALGAGNQPCGQGAAALAGLGGVPVASAGTAVIGAAKKSLFKKKKVDSTPPPASTPSPCPTTAQLSAAAAGDATRSPPAASLPGLPGGMSPMGMVAAMTPIGLAAGVAPGAVKGLKGMFGAKPQDKLAMLRELGKGRLELKGVKFIEGTAEMEPGYEPTFAQLGEAIALAEGTYILHVPAEAGDKGEAPDTTLARKRIEKVWAAILVNGVPDQRIIPVAVLSPELSAGRKPPKKGEARVEIIRLPKQP